MISPTFRTEAALCIWESMLESRKDVPALDAVWKNWGTVEMRQTAIALADPAIEAWQALAAHEQEDCAPFDWEFIPAFVRRVDWAERATPHTTPRQLALSILADIRKESRL